MPRVVTISAGDGCTVLDDHLLILGDDAIFPTYHHISRSSHVVLRQVHNTNNYTGMFPVGDTSCRTLIDVCVCVCVCVCVSLSADISLNCAKNDSTDYPEILWVCWV